MIEDKKIAKIGKSVHKCFINTTDDKLFNLLFFPDSKCPTQILTDIP